jgi:hypothetical protein
LVLKKGKQMSFSKFKATIKTLSDLSCSDLRDLFSWPSGGSIIQAENENLLIAKATNESGGIVAFVTAEPILLVDGYVLNPRSNREDDKAAGAVIDAALARRAGVNRLWVAIPDEAPIMEGEKFIRVLERRIHRSASTIHRLGCCDSQAPTAFIN